MKIYLLNGVFIISSFLICLSCGETNQREVNDSKHIVDTLTYLALGDSYTIGEAVSEEERWPIQLVSKASDPVLSMVDVRIIATTGWTTAELLEGIDKSGIQNEQFDIVSLLIGVNNQYRGYDIGIFENEFDSLLRMAIEFAKGKSENVFVVSIPDWGAMPFAEGRDRDQIRKEIDQYNQLKKQITASYNVQYFDITPISRDAVNDTSLVASDKLHPSGLMYQRWVDEVIFEWFKEKLSLIAD
jgi:lysophospholipase L1-like esterase